MIKDHMSKIWVKIRSLTFSFYLYISYLTFIKPFDIAGTHQYNCGYRPVNYFLLTKIKSLLYIQLDMGRVFSLTTLLLFATIINGKLTTEEVEYIKTPSKNVETSFRDISHKNFFQHRGIITGVSSYAHISIDFDFNWVRRSNREACGCINDLEKNLYQIGSMTSRKLARDQTSELRRTCDRLKKTTSDLESVFMPLETEINRHRESYEDLVEKTDHGAFTNGKYEGSEFTKASSVTRSTYDDVLNREKRVAPLIIGGIIGTLLGGGIGGGIGSLVSYFGGPQYDDDDIWQKTNVNSDNVDRLFNRTEEIYSFSSLLSDKIFNLQKTMFFDQAKDVCEGIVNGYEVAIGDIFQGLRSLAVGKLSPTLVDPVNLRSSLEKIDAEANRRRQNIAVNSVNELYTLPITLVRSHSTRLTITVDVPLFELRNRLSLWEYVSTPTEVKNATKTYGQAYYFRPENPYLALANDLYFKEYSIEELNRCTQIQGAFLCHSTVLTRDARHSCLYALYKGEHSMMEEECEIEMLRKSESSLSQVGANDFVAYFPEETTVHVECEIYRSGRAVSKKLTGLNLITIPEGCAGRTSHYRFHPIMDVGKYHWLVGVPSNFSIDLALDAIHPDQRAELVQKLSVHHATKFSVKRMQKSVTDKMHHLFSKPKEILISLISSFAMGVGNIAIILVIVIALIALCRRVRKTEQSKPTPIKAQSNTTEVESQPIPLTARGLLESPPMSRRPVTFQETSFIREIPPNTSHHSLIDQRPPAPRSIMHQPDPIIRPNRRRTYSIGSVDGITRSLMEARNDYNRY